MSESNQTATQPSISQQIQQKLAELAELVSIEEYGADGPPKDLTFRQIESVGYRVGQLAAEKFESTTADQHQQHFDSPHPCPQCGCQCEPQSRAERQMLTRLGPVNLSEIKFHCNACRRSFFPSA